MLLTPAKLAEARQRGMEAVLQGFAEECFALAPPPAAVLEDSVPDVARDE